MGEGEDMHILKNLKDRLGGQHPENYKVLWDLREGGMDSAQHDSTAWEHSRHSENESALVPCPLISSLIVPQ